MPDAASILDPIRVFVVWDRTDPADDAWSNALVHKLRAQLAQTSDPRDPPEDRPQVVEVPDFDHLPTPDEMGALSVLLVVLPRPKPGRAFSEQAEARLTALTKLYDSADTLQARVLPLSPEDGRFPPPAPMNELVGLRVDSASDADIARLLRHVLIFCSLLASSRQGRLFISYAQRDGKAVAVALEQHLKARGYEVWRDDALDHDGMADITPGSKAQATIKENILKHGFVLFVDTPAAATRPWVQAEVNLAFGHALPILPVVVEGDASDPYAVDGRPDTGGRFQSLQVLGAEVRLGRECLGNQPTDAADAGVAAKLDDIERQFARILLGHLRSRRRLLRHTRERFDQLQFSLAQRSRDHLLFVATRTELPDGTDVEIQRQLLVGCSPYRRLPGEVVRMLCDCHEGIHPFDDPPRRTYQWALLVHNATVAVGERKLLAGEKRYLRFLRPFDITDRAIL